MFYIWISNHSVLSKKALFVISHLTFTASKIIFFESRKTSFLVVSFVSIKKHAVFLSLERIIQSLIVCKKWKCTIADAVFYKWVIILKVNAVSLMMYYGKVSMLFGWYIICQKIIFHTWKLDTSNYVALAKGSWKLF